MFNHKEWYLNNEEHRIYQIVGGEHKASCQRFLEFLEDYVKGLDAVPVKISVKHKGLKQAIKLYDEAGI